MFSLRHLSEQAFVLLLIAFAVSRLFFGNPVIHSNSTCWSAIAYSTGRGRSSISYRKPVGLFLNFAAARSVGADGALMYQLAARLVVTATATAFLVGRIISRLSADDANRVASFGAGLVYLIWIIVFDGAGRPLAV